MAYPSYSGLIALILFAYYSREMNRLQSGGFWKKKENGFIYQVLKKHNNHLHNFCKEPLDFVSL